VIKIQNVQGMDAAQYTELLRWLNDCLRASVASRSTQIEQKYQNWQRNYDGVPKQATRSRPFQGASNFMPQLIKMHTDILTARVTGLITATRPIWKPSSFLSTVKDADLIALARWMQWKSMYALNLPERVDMLVHGCFKAGTIVLKDNWVEEARFQVLSGSNGQIQEQAVTKAEVKLNVLPFEDFYPYPMTALTLDDTTIQFHRIRLTEYEVQERKQSGR